MKRRRSKTTERVSKVNRSPFMTVLNSWKRFRTIFPSQGCLTKKNKYKTTVNCPIRLFFRSLRETLNRQEVLTSSNKKNLKNLNSVNYKMSRSKLRRKKLWRRLIWVRVKSYWMRKYLSQSFILNQIRQIKMNLMRIFMTLLNQIRTF